MSDRLHVNDDATRIRIVPEIIDQVAPAHVQHRTHRDEGAEAYKLAKTPIENGRAQRPALADEGDVAGARHGPGAIPFQTPQAAHDSSAVRPHHPRLPTPL